MGRKGEGAPAAERERNHMYVVVVVNPWILVLVRILASAVVVVNPWILVLVPVVASRVSEVLWRW